MRFNLASRNLVAVARQASSVICRNILSLLGLRVGKGREVQD